MSYVSTWFLQDSLNMRNVCVIDLISILVNIIVKHVDKNRPIHFWLLSLLVGYELINNPVMHRLHSKKK